GICTFNCPSERKYSGASNAPTSVRVPLKVVGSGIRPGSARDGARFSPYTWATVPGARGPPTIGFKLFSVPFGARIGTLFAVTDPVIAAVPAARFGAVPRAVTVIWVESLPGAHVPEYTPPAESVSFITNAGSPFEKVATTWPLTTGSPQSSASRIASVEG